MNNTLRNILGFLFLIGFIVSCQQTDQTKTKSTDKQVAEKPPMGWNSFAGLLKHEISGNTKISECTKTKIGSHGAKMFELIME